VDLAAYAVTRMPATLGALTLALGELPFAPETLIDFGAGPGTTLWAAREAFGKLPRATLVEQNTNWAEFAEELGLAPAVWRHADVRRLTGVSEPHEVAVVSYLLNEMDDADGERLLSYAWGAATRALVVVEPGTPAGAARILTARERLIGWGARIAAPCPHDGKCPLGAPDWCHFAVRVERSRIHRLAKGGELGYEDEKFSYLVALREMAGWPATRILRHPGHAPGRVELHLCTATGLETLVAGKRHPAWRRARKAAWGERWEPERKPAGE
jgi:ribosomal protein RSM22 (predicted rRNA methylase)